MIKIIVSRVVENSPATHCPRAAEYLLNADNLDRWFETVNRKLRTCDICFAPLVGLSLHRRVQNSGESVRTVSPDSLRRVRCLRVRDAPSVLRCHHYASSVIGSIRTARACRYAVVRRFASRSENAALTVSVGSPMAAETSSAEQPLLCPQSTKSI
jgi:hypothetical protein